MTTDTFSSGRGLRLILLLLIFLAALGVRLWFAWPTLTQPRVFQGDEASYYDLAISLLQGQGFTRNGLPTAYRPPGFPLFLAPVYALFGAAPFAAIPVLVLLNALICLGVYWLGREFFNPTVGLLAAAINAADVYVFIYGSYLLAETTFVLLMTFGLLALERLRRRQTWPWAAAVGLLWGSAMFTKANLLPFLPFLGGWIIYSGRDHLRRSVCNGLLAVGIIGLLWSAWIVRNYLALGAFIPVTTQGGSAYYGLYNDAAANSSRLGTYGQWQNVILPVPPNLSEVEYNRRYQEAGLAWIRAHPLQAAGVSLMQAVHFWRHAGVYLRLYAILFWYVMLFFSIWGYLAAWRRGAPGLAVWGLLAVVLTGVALITAGDPRYRIGLQPVFAVLSAVALLDLRERWRAGLARS